MTRYLIALLLCVPSFAADTGWVIAGAGATVSYGYTPWTSPGNITADDGANASSAPPAHDDTDRLKATSFTTSALIPVGATINGVEVKYQCYRASSGPEDEWVKLIVGGVEVGSNRATFTSWPATATDHTRGSSTDLWGTTLTRDQVIASDFGFVLQTVDGDTGGPDTAYVDAMWIKVYFTEAGGSPAPTPGFVLPFLETE